MGESAKDIKKAAALSYDEGDIAPKITAAGKGIIAENIVKAAERNKIPVFQDKKLIDSLLGLDLGSNIPAELYMVVAEVLAFVSYIDKARGEENV